MNFRYEWTASRETMSFYGVTDATSREGRRCRRSCHSLDQPRAGPGKAQVDFGQATIKLNGVERKAALFVTFVTQNGTNINVMLATQDPTTFEWTILNKTFTQVEREGNSPQADHVREVSFFGLDGDDMFQNATAIST